MKNNLSKILLLALAIAFCQTLGAQNPKREFRGAWMHTIGQSQYANQTTEQNKQYLIDQLDRLQACGVNAVVFQVRPAADALYQSNYELWSKFLTKDGKAPVPYWDPLKFMVEECHKRGMELHAWLNPYRVTTEKNEVLPKGHLYHREPKRFVKYEGDGKIYFDPGLPENRDFIVSVVGDIVEHYDIDAIHMDDYFYPYPANKKDFPDSKSYAKYGKDKNKDEWRRENVDKLIEQIHHKIRSSSKPWVRFGISPFGVWRNSSSDPRGSNTQALQNYDDLYADVLLWAEKGWIDYLVPQLYWELEHEKASYLVLVDWWANAVDPKCQLYIGQSVERTMNTPDIAPSKDASQLNHKMTLTRQHQSILGNCWWPGYQLTRDLKGCASQLAESWQKTPALVPAYSHINSSKPKAVSKVRLRDNTLTWSAAAPSDQATDATKFVVYRFDNEKDWDLEDVSNIVGITASRSMQVDVPGIYVVTAIDRLNNESQPSLYVRKK